MGKVLLETGALVVSVNDVRLGPSYVLMDNGVISAVGQGEFTESRDGVTVFRRRSSVAMPGLVNAHGHAAMTLLRGAGDDVPLMTWLEEKVFPLEAKLSEHAIYWGTMLACWEMIQSGTTCFTDMYFMMHNAAQAVEESGIRAVLSWGMVGFDDASKQKGIHNTKEFVRQWHKHGSGRITTTLGPHAPYTCPPEYLKEIAELSAELDVPIQIHLSETKVEVENSLRNYGKSPIAHSRDCGLFDRPTLAAHCVHVSAEDIEIMKSYNVRVAHNPQSNLKLASGVAPVVQMKQAGLTVGLGTDGAASNNNLDMFEELRLAAILHKGIQLDSTVIPAAEAFAMATADSARAVFLADGHGTLTPGAAADVTMLDLKSSHFQPNFNLLSNVVYASGADDVTDVFIAGSPVLLNREPVTLDVERIRYEVKKIEEFLKQ